MKTLVLFYSTYGHVWKLAEAIAEGAREIAGNEVVVKRVSETLSQEILDKTGATGAQKAFAHLPVVTPDELKDYDAIIFGTPTRYGNLCGQMQSFMDSTAARRKPFATSTPSCCTTASSSWACPTLGRARWATKK
jgi:NAD(P)H dehydrogenase (quinone)